MGSEMCPCTAIYGLIQNVCEDTTGKPLSHPLHGLAGSNLVIKEHPKKMNKVGYVISNYSVHV